jgi:putative membrane protein
MNERIVLLALVIILEVALGIAPKADRTTWLLENLPVFIILPCLFIFRVRFSLWTLRLMTLHALVLMLGGHYTYAEVPLGFWMQDLFHFSRNHYDRIGHLMQGFVPAFIFREWLLRRTPLKQGWLLAAIVVSFCLSVSALYELAEWAAALALGQGADAFLGTQGDSWDTQSDMFCALIGSVLALTLSRFHDRALQKG